ncbi:MAG: hypothetical protein SWZ49_17050 [Cyanobacteriota bacterium]|nr:hypothetical protein [Cyanobacteriota bacterium]
MLDSINKRLEQYTVKRPQEVLLVTVEINDERDEVAIFRGFSSSLMRPTAFDPDIPVIPQEAKLISLDRLKSPYNPESPDYIEKGLSTEAIAKLLAEADV